MPLEWASIRSMARKVFPVLVGPSTAVTPAPRALDADADVLEIITRPDWRTAHAAGRFLYHNATAGFGTTALRLSFGTSLEQIAPESLTRAKFRFVHGNIWEAGPRAALDRVRRRGFKGDLGVQFVKGNGRGVLAGSQAPKV
jgi:hypothetical protein